MLSQTILKTKDKKRILRTRTANSCVQMKFWFSGGNVGMKLSSLEHKYLHHITAHSGATSPTLSLISKNYRKQKVEKCLRNR